MCVVMMLLMCERERERNRDEDVTELCTSSVSAGKDSDTVNSVEFRSG